MNYHTEQRQLNIWHKTTETYARAIKHKVQNLQKHTFLSTKMRYTNLKREDI